MFILKSCARSKQFFSEYKIERLLTEIYLKVLLFDNLSGERRRKKKGKERKREKGGRGRERERERGTLKIY